MRVMCCVRRFVQSVRTALPSEPIQLAVLVGVLCLLIAPNLRWAPYGFRASDNPNSGLRELVAAGLFLIFLSATLCYFACFRPGSHPGRRLLWWVCFPAGLGLILTCGFYLLAGATSNFEQFSSNGPSQQVCSPISLPSEFSPGFHFALIGFTLIAGFTVRVGLGCASLPLALPKTSVSPSVREPSWDRIEIFQWVLLALLPLIRWVFPFALVYSFVRAQIPVLFNLTGALIDIIVDLSVILLAIWMVGAEARRSLRRSLRWPPLLGLVLGLLFPVAISVIISGGQSILYFIRSYSSPTMFYPWRLFFALPSIWQLGLVLPFALFEEVLFRGILQPHFIHRYGILRGIFLLGIVFAAAHVGQDFCYQDFSYALSDGLVVLKLVVRVTLRLTLSFVASWLTLRNGSVLPATIAHGLMNVLGSSPLGPPFQAIALVTEVLWAALAYLLFRYWPVHEETVPGS